MSIIIRSCNVEDFVVCTCLSIQCGELVTLVLSNCAETMCMAKINYLSESAVDVGSLLHYAIYDKCSC